MSKHSFRTVLGMGLSFGLALSFGCGDDSGDTSTGDASDSNSTTTGPGTESTPTQGESTMSGTTNSTTDTTTTMSTTDTTTTDTDPSTSTTDTDPSTTTDTESTTATTTDTTTTDTDSTTGGVEDCEAPGELITCDAYPLNDPFNAIELNCQGGPNEVIPISNESFNSQDPNAWSILTQYGTFIDPMTMEPLWSPTKGDSMLIISSGEVGSPDNAGALSLAPGSTQPGVFDLGNPDGVPMPAPMSPLMGSNNGMGGDPFNNCDGVNDCSDSLFMQWQIGGQEANDLLWFDFTLDVPGGTHGYEFDFVYFSAEFPEWVDTTYNDIFVVWSTSETYTGNLCFVNDEPCTVTALWPVPYTEFSPELANTGFDTVGGATGWFVAKGSAEPLETFELTWAVFDMGDTIYDTTVLLDNWRWDCEGCVPNEVNSCGIEPM